MTVRYCFTRYLRSCPTLSKLPGISQIGTISEHLGSLPYHANDCLWRPISVSYLLVDLVRTRCGYSIFEVKNQSCGILEPEIQVSFRIGSSSLKIVKSVTTIILDEGSRYKNVVPKALTLTPTMNYLLALIGPSNC